MQETVGTHVWHGNDPPSVQMQALDMVLSQQCKTLQVPSWKNTHGGVLDIKDNLKCEEFPNAQDSVLPSLKPCTEGKFPFSDGSRSDLWDARKSFLMDKRPQFPSGDAQS